MKSVGLETYQSKDKQKSRRRVAEYLFRHIKWPSSATVLYLPGPPSNGSDYQRKMLLSYGFCNENIIGADYGANVQAVRDAGGYCVEGKLEDVIGNWPRDRRIDVVLADLCCGLDKTAMRVMDAIGSHMGALVKDGEDLANRDVLTPLVYLNLQRGRDSVSNLMRKRLAMLAKPVEGMEKHRGIAAVCGLWLGYGSVLFQRGVSIPEIDRHWSESAKEMDVEYWSYRNGERSVWMDSILFKWPSILAGPPWDVDVDLRRRIAATLATATRRKLQKSES